MFGCVAYNFDQLRDGNLKLHSDGVRDILHWSDELVISSKQFPEQPVLCLGWEAIWGDTDKEAELVLNDWTKEFQRKESERLEEGVAQPVQV